MSAKRGDRAAPPPRPGEFDVRFATTEAAKGWDALCQQAPGNTAEAWQTMRTAPCPAVHTSRHKPLKGSLGRHNFRGRTLEVWQIEVTGGGRIWYVLDDHTVWIRLAGTGHPRATD